MAVVAGIDEGRDHGIPSDSDVPERKRLVRWSRIWGQENTKEERIEQIIKDSATRFHSRLEEPAP